MSRSDGGSVDFPQPEPGDNDDVAWAIQTANTMHKRGDHADAIRWLQRAADAAEEAGDDARLLVLARAAAEFSRASAAPPPPPVQIPPPPQKLPHAPPQRPSPPPRAPLDSPTAIMERPAPRPPPLERSQPLPAAHAQHPETEASRPRSRPPPAHRSQRPPPPVRTPPPAPEPAPPLEPTPQPPAASAHPAREEVTHVFLDPARPPSTPAAPPEPPPKPKPRSDLTPRPLQRTRPYGDSATATPKPFGRRGAQAVAARDRSAPAHRAVRVAVLPATSPGTFIVRPLAPGEPLITGAREALLVPLNPEDEFES
jgi:hypothetical protein